MDEKKIIYVNPKELREPKFKIREKIDEKSLNELAKNIEQLGLIHLPIVRKVNGYYEIVTGYRRIQAAIKAGLSKIKVEVKNISDKEALLLQLAENLHREEMDPISIAKTMQKMVEYGYKKKDIAKKIGKDQSYISHMLSLLKLPHYIQEALLNKKIEAGHALELRKLIRVKKNKEAYELLEKIIKEGLSVRQTRECVKDVLRGYSIEEAVAELMEEPLNHKKSVQTCEICGKEKPAAYMDWIKVCSRCKKRLYKIKEKYK